MFNRYSCTRNQDNLQNTNFVLFTNLKMIGRVIVLLITFVRLSKEFSLTIVHTNDIHGRFEETDSYGQLCSPRESRLGKCYGGVARRATKIKEIRSKEENVLLLDAGDVFTGTLWYDIYRGNATAKFMNDLQYDAMTLGNHEFDDGVKNLVRFLKRVNFSVVVSNLDVSSEPTWPDPPLFDRTKILSVGGEKIGLVGYVLQNTPRVSRPGPGPNVKFLPEVESVKKAVADLKRQNINKIIAVGHSGITLDKEIAKQVSDIDIVVGGHSNTFLYKGPSPTTDKPRDTYPVVAHPSSDPAKSVLVVHDYYYGKYLGYLKVTFDDEGQVKEWSGNPILLDSSVPKDPDTEQEVKRMKQAVDKVAKVKVGQSFVFLDGTRRSCGLAECNLGNLITDAILFHYVKQSTNSTQWSDVSIAIFNSITASIDPTPSGHVTYGHIYNSFPYKNSIDVVQLKGEDLLALFESVVAQYNTNNPKSSFLQVSGLQIKFDLSKPPNQRVVAILVRCTKCLVPKYEPLRRNAVYKIVLTSYLARGGAGFTILKNKKLSHYVGNTTESEALMEYMKIKSPITIGVENRIQFRDDTETNRACTKSSGVTNFSFISLLLLLLSLLLSNCRLWNWL